MANSSIIYIHLPYEFQFFEVFKTLSRTSRKDLFWNLSKWKKLPPPAVRLIGKMSS